MKNINDFFSNKKTSPNLLMRDCFSVVNSSQNKNNYHNSMNFDNKFIRKPYYGSFSTKEEYLNCLNILNLCTTEIRTLEEFLQERIFPTLKDKSSFLDVGVGNGSITHATGDKFSQITLIDPSLEALEKIHIPFKKVIKINKPVQEVQLQPSSFNFILLSHILYYLPHEIIHPLINHLYEALKDRGCLLMVISEDLHKRQIIEHFGYQPLKLESIILQHPTLANIMKISYSKETICLRTMECALAVASIFFNDASVTVKADDLEEYLESIYNKENNFYEFNIIQKYIVLNKQ
jgi:ubiquinone/menaquinone biosynthesis C-methylase UbiE